MQQSQVFVLDDNDIDDIDADAIVDKIEQPILNNRGQYIIHYSTHHLE